MRTVVLKANQNKAIDLSVMIILAGKICFYKQILLGNGLTQGISVGNRTTSSTIRA